jgi:hypothetical protein
MNRQVTGALLAAGPHSPSPRRQPCPRPPSVAASGTETFSGTTQPSLHEEDMFAVSGTLSF